MWLKHSGGQILHIHEDLATLLSFQHALHLSWSLGVLLLLHGKDTYILLTCLPPLPTTHQFKSLRLLNLIRGRSFHHGSFLGRRRHLFCRLPSGPNCVPRMLLIGNPLPPIITPATRFWNLDHSFSAHDVLGTPSSMRAPPQTYQTLPVALLNLLRRNSLGAWDVNSPPELLLSLGPWIQGVTR